MIYEIKAADDTVYVQADDWESAKSRLFKAFDKIPEFLLTHKVVDQLPDGEELV